jgi:cobalamin synthase
MDLFGLVTIGTFGILALIAWVLIYIATLVYQAKRRQWGWFILTLIFNIVLLIYWIVWLADPQLKRKRRK